MDSHERRELAAHEAAEWVIRLSSAEVTRSERIEYLQWLRESPMHVAEMLRVAGAHRRLTAFEGWSQIPALDPDALVATVHELPVERATEHASDRGSDESRHRRRWWMALPAAVLVGVLALVMVHFGELGSRTIVEEADQRREVKLPDGTYARVSPHSRLEVRYTKHERDVVLVQGNAIFTVAKDPSKPFIVETGRARVRAVGTIFGVEHDGSSVIVTVEEGRVAVAGSVERPDAANGSAAPLLQSIQITEISLGANQQVVVPSKGPMGAVRRVDSRRKLAWAEGRLVFDNESVADVVRQFNRFNQVQMTVTDPTLASRSVTAVFDATDPEAFILFLESVADVRVTRSSHEIEISSEGPH